MPTLGWPTQRESAHYTVTAVDARGRLADASPLRVLRWAPGLRIGIALMQGGLVAAAQPDGKTAVTSQGYLRLPADLRHALRLTAGDRLLVAAHTSRGLLVAYTMPTVDAIISGYHQSLTAGTPA